MKNKTLLMILAILINAMSSVVFAQIYNGIYNISFKINNQNWNYSDETSQIVIDNGVANLKMHYKMTDPKTALTNYAIAEGSGNGTLTGDLITFEGSGLINTFEKGKQDAAMNFGLNMQGRLSIDNNKNVIKGTFSLRQNGDNIRGSFSGTGRSHCNLKIIRGSCTVKHTGDGSLIEGKDNESLEVGCEINTGANTRVNIVFPDGSTFLAKSNTKLIVKNLNIIELTVGEVQFKVQSVGDLGFQVLTPSSVTGTLGTEFIVSVDKDKNSYINLLSGKIWVKDNTGKKITLEKGQSVVGNNSTGLEEIKTIDVDKVKAEFESSDNPVLSKKTGFSIKNINTTSLAIISALVILILLILIFALRKKKNKNIPPVFRNEPPQN